MLPVFCFMRLAARSSNALPPHTLLLEQMLPVLYTVGCAILYCATPHYTTVGADASRLAARSSTVLPPPALLLTQMLPVFYTVGCEQPFTVLPPYTTPRVNAACFGSTSVGVLGDLSLCYPPTLYLG